MPSQEEIQQAQKTLYDAGLQVRYDVAGKPYVDAALENGSSDFARPMQEYVQLAASPCTYCLRAYLPEPDLLLLLSVYFLLTYLAIPDMSPPPAGDKYGHAPASHALNVPYSISPCYAL